MYGKNGAGTGCYGCFGFMPVKIQSAWVGFDKHRSQSHVGDSQYGSYVCVCRNYNLVTGLEFAQFDIRAENKPQRIQTVAYANAVRNTCKYCKLVFESLAYRAAYESPRIDDIGYGADNLVAVGRDGVTKVEEGVFRIHAGVRVNELCAFGGGKMHKAVVVAHVVVFGILHGCQYETHGTAREIIDDAPQTGRDIKTAKRAVKSPAATLHAVIEFDLESAGYGNDKFLTFEMRMTSALGVGRYVVEIKHAAYIEGYGALRGILDNGQFSVGVLMTVELYYADIAET